jgi:hypothetical protein
MPDRPQKITFAEMRESGASHLGAPSNAEHYLSSCLWTILTVCRNPLLAPH